MRASARACCSSQKLVNERIADDMTLQLLRAGLGDLLAEIALLRRSSSAA